MGAKAEGAKQSPRRLKQQEGCAMGNTSASSNETPRLSFAEMIGGHRSANQSSMPGSFHAMVRSALGIVRSQWLCKARERSPRDAKPVRKARRNPQHLLVCLRKFVAIPACQKSANCAASPRPHRESRPPRRAPAYPGAAPDSAGPRNTLRVENEWLSCTKRSRIPASAMVFSL